jgi:HPt (histidine-containing phosphotransfer) domain-containing protein
MSGDPAGKIAARLAELWFTSRPTVLERISLLQASCETLSRNPADPEARSQGREAAHKLSGILGVFGLPQGSELASSIEFRLKSEEPLTPDDLAALSDQIADLDTVIASRPES